MPPDEENALHNREVHVSGKFVIKDDPINAWMTQ